MLINIILSLFLIFVNIVDFFIVIGYNYGLTGTVNKIWNGNKKPSSITETEPKRC